MTTTASVPAVTTVPLGTKKLRWQKLMARRPDLKKQVKEGDEVIPAGAVAYTAPTDDEAAGAKKPKEQRFSEPLLPSSLALVAPGTTPDGEKPLDATQVPQPLSSTTPPKTEPVVELPGAAGQPPVTPVLDLFRLHNERATESLSRSGSAAMPAEVNPEAVEQSLAKSKVTTTLAESKAAEAASRVMAAAHGGVMPEPTQDKNSMGKTVAAFRQIMGD